MLKRTAPSRARRGLSIGKVRNVHRAVHDRGGRAMVIFVVGIVMDLNGATASLHDNHDFLHGLVKRE